MAAGDAAAVLGAFDGAAGVAAGVAAALAEEAGASALAAEAPSEFAGAVVAWSELLDSLALSPAPLLSLKSVTYQPEPLS